GAGAAFVYDGDGAAELLLVHQRLLDAPLIGAEDDQIVRSDVQAADEFIEDRTGVQVIDGDVEKALNLGGVQIEREHAMGAGGRSQGGGQLGRDRYSAHILAVLAGVAVIAQDGGDTGGAGPLEAVDHNQQLHQVLVDRRTGRLHYKNVPAAHVFLDADGVLAVGEIGQRDAAQSIAE